MLQQSVGLKYSGIDIKAAFKAHEEAHRIEQLSGGEKTLVAIALIFAIQRYASHAGNPALQRAMMWRTMMQRGDAALTCIQM